MRICLLSTIYPPDSTEGIARQRQVLAAELARQGHEVHVVTCGAGHFLRFEQGVWVHEVRVDRLRHFSSKFPLLDLPLTHSQALYEGLEQIARRCSIDIVDVPLWAAQGFAALWEHLGPVIVWLQTTRAQLLAVNRQSVTSGQRALLSLERSCLERAQGWLADSQAILKSTATDYDLRPSVPTSVAYLGLPLVKQIEFDRAKPDNIIALVVGRLERRKGTSVLFKILPQLLLEHPQLIVRFIGSDNSRHDGWYTQRHLTYPEFFQRHHPDLAHRVLFEGYVDDVLLNQAYQTSDFLIAPSLFESFGLAFIEAMRAGLPVIAFAAGAATEIFDQAELSGALLVPPYDETQLTMGIRRLVQQADLRHTLGQNGRMRFQTSFTAEIMATQTARFYEKVAEYYAR
jgi:hypothetical protein